MWENATWHWGEAAAQRAGLCAVSRCRRFAEYIARLKNGQIGGESSQGEQSCESKKKARAALALCREKAARTVALSWPGDEAP